MCSRSSILLFHIYIYFFFFTLFSYKSNSHQAEKRGYLCGVWCRQEQVIGVLYTVHLLFEFSAVRFIVFLPLKEIHPRLKNTHGPDAWEIWSNPPTTTHRPTQTLTPYSHLYLIHLFCPSPWKKTPPATQDMDSVPTSRHHQVAPLGLSVWVSSSPDPEPSGFLDWKWARICGKKSRIFASRPPAESFTRDCNVQPGRRALFWRLSSQLALPQ